MNGNLFATITAVLCGFASLLCFVTSFTINQQDVANMIIFVGFLWMIPLFFNLYYFFDLELSKKD